MIVRPLLPVDVSPSQLVTEAALAELDRRMGRTPHEPDEATRERGRRRIAHLQQTDPGSAWVAEVDGEVVGCGLALVRDGMWFLSLLMVAPEHQGAGVGRALLDATLTTATDRSWIMATDDPAALRRYQQAGFSLHPSFTAKGRPDLTRMPAVTDVLDGVADRETLDDVLRAVRGAAMGPEVDYWQDMTVPERGDRLLVRRGRGFAVLRQRSLVWLAATDEGTARDLLWVALAEGAEKEGDLEVDWLTADQQWAIDVCLQARLSLHGGASLCLRGQPRMQHYLPCGAFG